MMKDMKWRLIIIAGVIGLSVFSFYPPQQKVRLGLDLKGGVYLVLRVKTDDALRVETETTVERLRDSLQRAGVQFTKADVVSATEFRVDGIQDDAGYRTAAADADTNYDRSSDTSGYSYRMKPNVTNQLRDGTVTQSLETIERRVNELGVAEPIVSRYGGQDQIMVQLPGVTEVRRAKEIIRSTAQLKLTLVDQGPFPSRESALQAFNNVVPPDVEILPGRQEGGGTGGTAGTVFYAVKRAAAVTGRDLRNAQQSLDEFNRPAVGFTLKQDAAGRFGNFTQTNIGRPMAIVLDNRVMSVATIQGRITDQGQITGINREEMIDTVITLKSGALPASMEYLEERTVGPSLGEDSIRSGVTAAVGGLILVVVFMLGYYKLAGFNALTSIVVNLVILLGMMSYLGAAMTLPGIAGFILTIAWASTRTC
jgi:preprotein translocase subunit SecD